MAMHIIDISVSVRPGMVTYPGDPEVVLERVRSIEGGEGYNLSRISLGLHTGTHVDAPLHFVEGGADAEALPLEVLVGPATVVDATAVESRLSAAALAGLALPERCERVLFKTRNSELWRRAAFSEDVVSLTQDGAQELVSRGVRLVGIDYLSIGDEGAHRVLLGSGVVALEGLDLGAVEPGDYLLVCAPLKLAGAEGAPTRALLIRD
jgi:arylformamidase